MLFGLFNNSSRVESLLNNLSEADFELGSVSVIMTDTATRDKIARDVGPLKGVRPDQLAANLARLGLSKELSGHCVDMLQKGMILVAMNVPQAVMAAAKEMFQDQSGQIIDG